MNDTALKNPILDLQDERRFESLGEAYYEPVPAAEFPQHLLRFRNDRVMADYFGLSSSSLTDQHYIQTFGKFEGQEPFLALAYHGYQFGTYNPQLGDGRGFLLRQVRGADNTLFDFGTKGSGRTPFSRTADGRLTLKGGVREAIASEALHYAGVHTSRVISLIETGESLWRGDEPSPTRASVMVRLSRSHVRFGTFERLQRMNRPDLVEKLLNYVIEEFYPECSHRSDQKQRYADFYHGLVQRTARLAAQWMAVGFCHAVLNTDNMSITGESFDYGPFAFIPTYDPDFTAAYFDYYGRYRYGNQPGICHWNLEMLQRPLSQIIDLGEMQSALETYRDAYVEAYGQFLQAKLGFPENTEANLKELLLSTLDTLQKTQIGYAAFFSEIRMSFSELWQQDAAHILGESSLLATVNDQFQGWRQLYYQALKQYPEAEMGAIALRLHQKNPLTVPTRPLIEAVWEPIAQQDDWQPFKALMERLQSLN